MITLKEETTLVGLSEFRIHAEKIIEESRKHKVIIGKRNKPIAVLLDMERYNQMEHTLELLEDFALGVLAKERDSKTKVADYVDIEKLLKRIKK